ncbi:major facilitator superfamily transporter [Gluconacetobacter sacchari DSM 12717]|uniref:MFS transporter n=2 Tax=Gluconacetobacter sacchari TaxID=92759 RepID=A0A7W4IEL8_9PROT|nr:MFS transporter [Gluconacetobacter sacchari]MBB2161425.1 MFS transporter [Gluconacetobacter sacchari]GBQ26164.1 major facilitator superfamily transporter [Gluconacetobacter sacchari DSM 12717]
MKNLFILFFLFMCALLSYTDREVLSLFVDFIKNDLSVDNYQFALLIGTFFGVVYAVMGLPTGWMVDRLPRKPLLCGAIAVWSAGTILCGLAHHFPQMLAGRILVACGEAALAPVALSLIGDLFPGPQQGRAMGFYFTGIVAGGGVSIIIGGLLLGPLGDLLLAPWMPDLAAWRRIFVFLGCVGFVMSVLSVVSFAEPARKRGGPARETVGRDGGGRETLSRLARLCLAVAILSVIDNAVGAWAPYAVENMFGLSPARVGEVLGWFMIAGGLGGVTFGGMVSDRYTKMGRPRGVLRIVLALLCVLILPCLMIGQIGYPLTLLMITVIIAIAGACSTIGLNLILQFGPADGRGMMTSISFFLNVLVGASAGPLLVPVVQARLAHGATLNALCIVVAAAAICSATLLLPLSRSVAGKASIQGRSIVES